MANQDASKHVFQYSDRIAGRGVKNEEEKRKLSRTGAEKILFEFGSLADQGPGAPASFASLILHALAVTGIVLGWRVFTTGVVVRPARVTILQESRLFSPVQPKRESLRTSGGGGNRSVLPSSKGPTPPRTNTRTFFMPLAITDLHPKLRVSPTLLDVPPPQILDKLTYGDPQAQLSKLSAGPGTEGIGAGREFGDGAGSGGSGYGSRGYGGGVFGMDAVSQGPVLVYKVDPDYTDQARKARYQGTVLLRLVIDQRGHPEEVRVIRPLGLGLDEKAVEAVYRWRFRPGLKDGQAVAVDANVEVTFHLL